MPNFSDILKLPPSSFERPRPLPPGSYHCIIKEPPTNRTASTGTEVLSFVLHPVQAMEDVSKKDLEAMGGIGSRTLKADFFITKDATYRLTKFLKDLGLEEEDYETVEDMINDSINREVLAVVRHNAGRPRPGQTDEPAIFANVVETARVD